MFFQAVGQAAANQVAAVTQSSSISPVDHLMALITAVGALGTAAYGLVDSSKGFGGGVSVRGMAYIRASLTPLLPDTAAGAPGTALSRDAIFETLKSNWINGEDSSDQQAIAKSLIKLRMDAASAAGFAKITGVSPTDLANIVGKMSDGTALTPAETDTYARFDLVLSTIVGQAYQRADQQYRNTAKLLSVPVSVALAAVAALAMNHWKWSGAHLGIALVLGLVATPLAPIAKDVSTAVQTAAKAMQAWKS
jgi:hypothetical protein